MTGNTSSGTINLATGTGSAKVNIGNGTTTGAIQIGNPNNIVTIASSNLSLGTFGGGPNTIGSTGNTTSIFGTVKLPNLANNNYTFRNHDVAQVVLTGTNTRVRFLTVRAGSAAMLGLTYLDGTFTNSNSSGNLMCHISYSIAYSTNAVGIRYAGINTSSGLPTSGTVQFDANAATDMFLTGSTILILPSAATFDVGTFQNSGSSLTLITPNTNIQVLVL